MPIPVPRSNEKRSSFISRCISFVAKESPDRPHKQRIAMCYTSWRKHTGQKQLSKEDLCALVADLLVESIDKILPSI